MLLGPAYLAEASLGGIAVTNFFQYQPSTYITSNQGIITKISMMTAIFRQQQHTLQYKYYAVVNFSVLVLKFYSIPYHLIFTDEQHGWHLYYRALKVQTDRIVGVLPFYCAESIKWFMP